MAAELGAAASVPVRTNCRAAAAGETMAGLIRRERRSQEL